MSDCLPYVTHLCGIVPVSGHEVDVADVVSGVFHPSLRQLSGHLVAIQRAILECNYAGCKTIWVVCNEDMQPLIRHVLGDFTHSIDSLISAGFAKYNKSEKLKSIPIFYVAIPASKRDKRDSLGWSILHAANEAFLVSSKISKWVIPSKYFVSFPYGVHCPKSVSDYKKILGSKYNVMLEAKGQSVASGDYLSFSFNSSDFKKIRTNIKNNCSGSLSKPYWSSRNFSLDKFYNYDNIDNIHKIEIGDYFPCTSWGEYLAYTRSSLAKEFSIYDYSKLAIKLRNNERILNQDD